MANGTVKLSIPKASGVGKPTPSSDVDIKKKLERFNLDDIHAVLLGIKTVLTSSQETNKSRKQESAPIEVKSNGGIAGSDKITDIDIGTGLGQRESDSRLEKEIKSLENGINATGGDGGLGGKANSGKDGKNGKDGGQTFRDPDTIKHDREQNMLAQGMNAGIGKMSLALGGKDLASADIIGKSQLAVASAFAMYSPKKLFGNLMSFLEFTTGFFLTTSLLLAVLLALFDPNGTFIDMMVSMIDQFVPVLEQAISGFLEALPQFITNFINIFEKIWGVLIPKITGVIQLLLDKVPMILNKVIPLLGKAFTGIVSTLAKHLPPLLMSLLNMFTTVFFKIVPTLLNSLISILPMVTSALVTGAGTFIKELAKQIPVLLPMMAQAIGGILDGVWNAIMTMIFGDGAKKSSFFTDTLMKVSNVLIGTFNTIWGIIKKIDFEKIFNTIRDVLSKIDLKAIFSGIGSVFTGIFDVVKKIDLVNIFKTIGSYLEKLMPPIQNIVKSILDGLGKIDFKGIFNVVKDVVLSVIDKAIPALKNIIDKIMPVVQNIITKIQEAMPTIMNIIKNIVDLFIWLKPVFLWVVDSIFKLFNGVFNYAMGILSPIIDQIISTFMLVINGLDGFITMFKGIFSGDWKMVKEGFFKVIDTIFTYFKDTFKNIGKFVLGLFGIKPKTEEEKEIAKKEKEEKKKARELEKAEEAKMNAIKRREFFLGVSNIFTSIGNNLKNFFKIAWDGFLKLPDIILDALTFIPNKIADLFTSIFSNLKTTFKGTPLETLFQFFEDVGNGVKKMLAVFNVKTFTSFFTSIATGFKDIWETFKKDGLKGIFDKMLDFIASTISNFFQGVATFFDLFKNKEGNFDLGAGITKLATNRGVNWEAQTLITKNGDFGITTGNKEWDTTVNKAEVLRDFALKEVQKGDAEMKKNIATYQAMKGSDKESNENYLERQLAEFVQTLDRKQYNEQQRAEMYLQKMNSLLTEQQGKRKQGQTVDLTLNYGKPSK